MRRRQVMRPVRGFSDVAIEGPISFSVPMTSCPTAMPLLALKGIVDFCRVVDVPGHRAKRLAK